MKELEKELELVDLSKKSDNQLLIEKSFADKLKRDQKKNKNNFIKSYVFALGISSILISFIFEALDIKYSLIGIGISFCTLILLNLCISFCRKLSFKKDHKSYLLSDETIEVVTN